MFPSSDGYFSLTKEEIQLHPLKSLSFWSPISYLLAQATSVSGRRQFPGAQPAKTSLASRKHPLNQTFRAASPLSFLGLGLSLQIIYEELTTQCAFLLYHTPLKAGGRGRSGKPPLPAPSPLDSRATMPSLGTCSCDRKPRSRILDKYSPTTLCSIYQAAAKSTSVTREPSASLSSWDLGNQEAQEY